MAGKNIFKGFLHPKSQVSRNGFDLSHRKVFSAKAGELLPILCEDLVPGDYFEIDTATLCRTMPLNTAAFLRAKLNFDFFFVPKTAIWRQWNNFINQRTQLDSSYINGSLYEPNIPLGELEDMITDGSTTALDSVEARRKLCQLLGYGYGLPTGYDVNNEVSLSALPIYAYNYIYNMYYRNAWRDEPTAADAQYYSADDVNCSTYNSSLLYFGSSFDKFVQMHYHGWYKDLFMGSLPNSQFGAVSQIALNVMGTKALSGITSSDLGTWSLENGDPIVQDESVLTSAAGTLKYDSSRIVHQHNVVVDPRTQGVVGGTSFDVLTLRRALALQKWKEYNMRAGWKNNNQQRAMFGVDLPSDSRHELQFIDSYDTNLMVDEVVSTANTSDAQGTGSLPSNLGDLGGKGIAASGSKKIKFSANQHGYLFCIFYVMPEAEYDARMYDRTLVRSEAFDHFNPAFENLGMQAIHLYELYPYGNKTGLNEVIGYAPNYYEYKQRIDKCYGSFMSGMSFSSWVSSRRDIQAGPLPSGIPINYFYVHPSVLDPIFVQNADQYTSSDQFLVNCNFNIKTVRPMSVLGLPQF